MKTLSLYVNVTLFTNSKYLTSYIFTIYNSALAIGTLPYSESFK